MVRELRSAISVLLVKRFKIRRLDIEHTCIVEDSEERRFK